MNSQLNCKDLILGLKSTAVWVADTKHANPLNTKHTKL